MPAPTALLRRPEELAMEESTHDLPQRNLLVERLLQRPESLHISQTSLTQTAL